MQPDAPSRGLIGLKPVLLALLILVLTPTFSAALADTGDGDALAAVTQDLCHRQIAMLGESNTHGDGHTEAFKVALVERLVTECGFDSVLFEASHYEFINIERRLRTGQPVSTDDLSSAVGGLWKFDREFQPLVPFLLAKAQTGQIFLGGIDDQLGGLGQDYANVEMVTELTSLLSPQEKQDCSLVLHRRIYSDYTDAAPYSQSDHSRIATCLSSIQAATTLDKTADVVGKQERQEMISAVQRWVSRDFVTSAEQFAGRDRSMFQNFEWLRTHYPRRHKVILWSATVHIAKQADPLPPALIYKNFGSYVHRQYGRRAFSLGFSALTGSYRQGRRDVHDLPKAPALSLEAQALQQSGADTAYIDQAQLVAMGSVPGAAIRHSYQTLAWANYLDGIVVFREERPPDSTR